MYNELAIFNDAYFDNDDYDVDSANESIAGWLLANFAVFATLLIKTIVRYSKRASKSHKTIVSVNDMVAHGMSRAEATKYAKKSIEWLRNRGYTYIDSSAPVLMYNDLTTEGRQFVDGYFEYIGDMDTFSVRKAVNANKSKLATLSRVADNVTAVLNTIIIVFYTAVSPGGILLFPATLAVAYWAGTDLGESIVRIINQVRYSDKKPNAADALESAYEDGYYQALADIGYEFDDASEDVDIFDEDCFDDASEGAARDYRKKMNHGKSQTYIQNERRDNRRGSDIIPRKPRKPREPSDTGIWSDLKKSVYAGDMKRYKNRLRERDEALKSHDTPEGTRLRREVSNKRVDQLIDKYKGKHSDDYDIYDQAADMVNKARKSQHGRKDHVTTWL